MAKAHFESMSLHLKASEVSHKQQMSFGIKFQQVAVECLDKRGAAVTDRAVANRFRDADWREPLIVFEQLVEICWLTGLSV